MLAAVEAVRGCTSVAMKVAVVVMYSFVYAVSLERRYSHHSNSLRCPRQRHLKVELGVDRRQRIVVGIGSRLGVVVAVMAVAGKQN